MEKRIYKRKHRRIKYARKVNIKTQIGWHLNLEIFDYSMGGMSLVSYAHFNIGDILEFEYLINQHGNKRLLDLQCEVIHSQKEFREYTIGVCFL